MTANLAQNGETFFEMLREIAPSLPIIGLTIEAAIYDKAIDDLLAEDITV